MGASRLGGGLWRALAVVITGLGVVACQPPPSAPAASATIPAPAVAASDVGSVSFELKVAGKFRFDQVSYDISGNGFHRSSAVDVSSSSTLSGIVADIPAGHGYALMLTAQDTGGQLTPCVGSATFDIAGGATVSVPVHMTCHERVATTPPPPAVPLPRPAVAALALALLALGASRVRRPTESRRPPAAPPSGR